jgi:hypothetical protein
LEGITNSPVWPPVPAGVDWKGSQNAAPDPPLDEAPLEEELDDEELDELEVLEPEELDEVELPDDEELPPKLLLLPPPQADSSRHKGARKIHRRMACLRDH